MKESLESARNIHQIIIFISAVIAVFALSLRTDLNKYDKARLRLQDINLAIKDVNEDRVKRIKSAAYEGNHKRFNLFTDQSFYRNLRISDIRENLFQNWDSIDSIDLVYDGGNNMMIVRGSDSTFSAGDFPVVAKPSVGAWRSERDYYYGSDYIRAFRLKGFFTADGNLDSLFSDIQPVWFDVKNLSLESAMQNLAALSAIEVQKGKGDVDVSGLKVTGDLIYIIGPSILLMLLIYLATLTVHIKSLIKIKEQAETAQSFPWLALFRNIWSKVISFISLIILPFFVSALIVYKTQLKCELMVTMLVAYLILFVGIGSILVYQLHLLRRKIKILL
ncbi:hypothetical protein L0663_05175 [Dyadobacter sp. CY107]|uniref:hypothetical protein n=1 Tax=Dyadobacter fanqingshengii TaxID=2906443 RepID=UPI001F313D32|nr:hypothetical protein [Dyadobacter fanqingshengii]MCF2502759.1 hypothetical protein [Dyadobacter fanqingshengii]